MQITAILTPNETAKAASETTTAAAANSTEDFSSYLEESTSDNSLTAIFQKASETYGVSFSLLTAMAKQESNFQSDATSSAGAMGVMQLMPATAASLGCTDAYDPEQNIMAGAKYISQLLQKYDGNVSLALAAYNAGSSNVDKYGGIPPFEETQNYVAKITAYLNEGVTLPDGFTTTGTSDSSVTSSNLQNLDADSLKKILNQIFSYEDYMTLLNRLVSVIQDTSTQTALNTVSSDSSTTSDTSDASGTSANANTATGTGTTTAAAGSDKTASTNGALSVKVVSNPSKEASDSASTDSDLYYAYKNINYNNSVLNLMSQNSSST